MTAPGSIVLIGNPVAGREAFKRIRTAEKLLAEQGAHVQVMLTSRRGDAEAYARQLAQEKPLRVIAAGGDGTYNEVANGLAHSDIPMAILPLGTVSVLAHEIGLPQNLRKAVALALNGTPRTISLGKITFLSRDDGQGRHFLLMAGIGFDGDACFGINPAIKRRVGKLAYILSGIRVLAGYSPSPLRISGRGVPLISQGRRAVQSSRRFSELPAPQPFVLTGYAVVAGKAACYGGPQKITPLARLDEPSLHIFVHHGSSRAALLRLAAGVLTKRHLSLGDTSYLAAQELEVTGPAHVQIDGDYAGVTPVRIEVVPEALRLVTG